MRRLSRRTTLWLGVVALLLAGLAVTPWVASANPFKSSPANVAQAQGQPAQNHALDGVPLRNNWWLGMSGVDPETKMHRALTSSWESNPALEQGFMVYLKAQADTTNSITDWNAKGEYVLHQLETVAGATQPSVVQAIAAQQAAHNVSRFTRFTIVNAIFVRGNYEAANSLAHLENVAFVEPDTKYTLQSSATVESVAGGAQAQAGAQSSPDTIEPGVNWVHAPQVWATGDRGQGIVVGSIDTGVQYDHPALVRQYRGNLGGSYDHNYNWFDTRVDAPRQNVPYDDYGHGTHTTGTVLGEDASQTNQIGVAPGAKWIAAKVFPNGGSSGNEEITTAEDFMLAPWDLNKQNRRPDLRPNIITNSWGDNECWNTDSWLITQAWIDAGMYPVFANGNNGPGTGTVGSPGGYPFLLGVGAIDASTNAIAGFSSRGPSCYGGVIKPDVVAPGVNVRSSVPGSQYQGGWSGTSMATPHVSGVVALMLSADPTLSYTDVRSIITRTAYFYANWGTRPNNNFGYGGVRADDAVNMILHGARLHGTVTAPGAVELPRVTAQRVSDNNVYSMLTRPNGTYSMTLLAGTYNFTATAFGFNPQVVSSVTVMTDTAPTQDFTLTPQQTYPVTGQLLMYGSCAPISGTVGITPPGTITVTNNPANGQYAVNLPAGTYTFVAHSGAYLQPVTDTVTVSGPTVHDFTLGPAHDAGNTYYVDQPSGFNWVAGTSLLSVTDPEDGYATISLPFTFNFYGSNKTTMYASTDGYLEFLGTNYGSMWANTNIPNPGPTSRSGSTYLYPNDAIYPYWDDLSITPRAYGSMYSGVSGTAPNRIFVVEWRGVAGTGAPITFEVQLEETTNKITFLYQNISTPYGNGYSATVGIENATGTDAIQLGWNQRGLIGDNMAVRFNPGTTPSFQLCGAATPTVAPPTSTPVEPTATPGGATPTPCTISFTDVPPENTFYPYVRCLACRGVLGGYSDGTYRPNNNITRGQIAKVVSNAAAFNDPIPSDRQTYTDVPSTNTFWEWIERLTIHGVMSGYNCGVDPNEPCDPQNRAYFRWANNATRAQLAKIDSNAAGYSETPTTQTFADVDNTHPFYVWIERLATRSIMGGYQCGIDPNEPCDPQNRPYFRPYNNVTRGQAAKIVANTFYPNCNTPR